MMRPEGHVRTEQLQHHENRRGQSLPVLLELQLQVQHWDLQPDVQR